MNVSLQTLSGTGYSRSDMRVSFQLPVKGQITFFALYVFAGNSFPSRSMSPRRHNKSVKLLLDHLLLAFSFNRSSTLYNNVNLPLHPGKSGFSEALIKPTNCSYSLSVPCPWKSRNICSTSGPESASSEI